MSKFNTILLFSFLFFTCCKKENLNGNTPGNKDTIPEQNNPADTITDNPVDTIVDQTPDTIEIITRPQKYFLYASLDNDNKIAVYQMDTVTGKLTFIEKIQTAGSPGSLATSISKKYLYAALRSAKQVASFKIDEKTGKLRFIQNTNVADNPVYVIPDKTNKYLLTAYWSGNKVAIYPIMGDSVISQNATQEFDPGVNPHCIVNDAGNQFTYVAVMTSGNVNQYSFNSSTGKLTALSPDKVALGENIGPRHVSFHPDKKWVYIVNEINNTIYAYNRDTVNGTLSKFDEINTLPASFTEFSKCADIHVTSNGKYVYASNRGHNSIAGFTIDQVSGKLSLINQYDTEPSPREFEVEPGGRYLYAGGEESGKIAAYKINENGSLQKIETYAAGSKVTWLMVVGF